MLFCMLKAVEGELHLLRWLELLLVICCLVLRKLEAVRSTEGLAKFKGFEKFNYGIFLVTFRHRSTIGEKRIVIIYFYLDHI